jgi:hypothetical protein
VLAYFVYSDIVIVRGFYFIGLGMFSNGFLSAINLIILQKNIYHKLLLINNPTHFTKNIFHHQLFFIPPIKVLASGTLPLNYAPLKSKPGCSS